MKNKLAVQMQSGPLIVLLWIATAPLPTLAGALQTIVTPGWTIDHAGLFILHPAIDADDEHQVSVVGGVGGLWKFDMTLKETDKTAKNNDILSGAIRVQHLKAAHAKEDAPNKLTPTVKLKFEVGKGGVVAAKTYIVSPPAAIEEHTGTGAAVHYDGLLCVGHVTVNANLQDIDNYGMAMEAWHVTKKDDLEAIRAKMINNFTNQGTPKSELFGAVAATIEPSSGNLNLSLELSFVATNEILAASIRQGSTNNPGPVILDVPLSSFVPAGTLGVGLGLVDVQFPTNYVSDLISSNTFVEISTTYGEVSGQLTTVPLALSPTLTITKSNSFVVLSWPLDPASWPLEPGDLSPQVNPDLSTTNWSEVLPTETYHATVPITAAPHFFELVGPDQTLIE
jgi:hypothetical protein